MGIIKDIKWINAINRTGFKITGAKTFGTADGYAFEATLAKGATKLAVVSNGGYGGPDMVHLCDGPKMSVPAIKAVLAEFFALPEVVSYCQDHEMSLQEMLLGDNRISQIEFEQKKAEILAKKPNVSEEMLGYVVDDMRANSEFVSKLKRKAKTHVMWVEKGKESGPNYVSVKLPDTPENRARIEQKYKATMGPYISDLLAA